MTGEAKSFDRRTTKSQNGRRQVTGEVPAKVPEVEWGGDDLRSEVRGSFHSGCEADLELSGCTGLSGLKRDIPGWEGGGGGGKHMSQGKEAGMKTGCGSGQQKGSVLLQWRLCQGDSGNQSWADNLGVGCLPEKVLKCSWGECCVFLPVVVTWGMLCPSLDHSTHSTNSRWEAAAGAAPAASGVCPQPAAVEMTNARQAGTWGREGTSKTPEECFLGGVWLRGTETRDVWQFP